MKLLNFAIGGQNIDLEWPDGGYADLHNDFSFVRLCYEPSAASATLEWRKSTGEWAKKVRIASIKLIFSGVTFLRVRERDSDYPLSEDDCLSEVGWLPPDERDNFDSFYASQDAQFSYDLILRFQSEWAIKLNAVTAELAVEML